MTDSELQSRARVRLGSVLRGKYRLDRVLGIGGMATVYAATHRNRAEFAVKILHPELSIREDIRSRFLREGYVANSVKHPGVVRVVDDDVADDGAAFLVMELLEGAGLEQVWERQGMRMPLIPALAVLDQLLEVLAIAHQKGIVHRDIKPANLFVMRDGQLKVLDFGIARVREAATDHAHGGTATGMLLGTPAFMSPEQALAKSREIDAQTDVWAAAATFFALVTGRTVHQGENAPQLLVSAATTKAPSLAEVLPGTPAALVRVLDKGLAFHKGERWRLAGDMREALQEAQRAIGLAPGGRDSLVALIGEASPRERSAPSPTVDDAAFGASFAGGTTAQPLSRQTEADVSVKSSSSRRGLVVVSVATLAILAAGALGVSRLRGGSAIRGGAPAPVASDWSPSSAGAAPPAQSVSPSAAASDIPPLAPTSAPSGLSTLAVVPGPGPGKLGSTKGPPTALPAPASAPSATVAPPPPAVVTSAPTPAPPTPQVKPAANCDPPWVLGADGIKHWKDECTK